MKLAKKQALFLTLLATCAGFAVGCGSEPEASETSKEQSNSQATSGQSSAQTSEEKITPVEPTTPVTIKWWNNYKVPSNPDDESTRSGSTYREYWYARDLIAEFSKAHPNITVETSYKGSYSDIVTATSTALGTGDQPNIVSCYGDSVAVFRNASEDAVLDMTGYAQNLVEDTDFNQNYLSIEKSMYGGRFYSLPYSKSAETLVVNQSMFDKVGAGKAGTDTIKGEAAVYTAPVAAASKKAYTIPENIYGLMDLARTMKTDFPELFADQKDENGFFKAVPFCWDSAENMFISALKNSGIDYTDGTKENAVDRVLFKNDDAKKLMVQMKKWNNEGLFCTQSQLPITDAAKGYHQYSSNMVVAGSIAMCVSSTAGARYFATDGGFKASFYHPVSWKENGQAKDANVISQGPSLCFFDKGKEANDASFIFYQYLTNATNSGALAAATSYFPLRAKGYENETIAAAVTAATTGTTAEALYKEKNTTYTGNVLALNTTYTENNNYFLSPVFSESSATRTAVGKLVAEVFDNQKVTTDAEIEAAVNTAFDNAYNSIMA